MPIDFYLLDWLNLLLRWAHLITGIAWIGSSFYFIWLDARLNVPPRDPENADVAGDLWAVHGGGFYHSQKYKVAPAELPTPLHWFKWEAYSTWLTGFALVIVVYYLNAGALLVDPAVAEMNAGTAVVTSLALLLGGWLVYDGLCRTGLSGMTFALVGGALLLGVCWGVTQIFGGRGAFMQIGAMIGTIMAGNVWRVIIPSQKQLVAAKVKGKAADARLGAKAKQRSVHNNYLTLPVVFVMISPHFAFTYAHAWNWAVLFAIFVAGALIRHYFNLRNQGRHVVALPVTALALLAVVGVVTAPRGTGARSGSDELRFAEIQRIMDTRCVPCHSAKATHPTSPTAAAGVMLDTARQIAVWKQRIYDRTVVTKTMPFNNFTEMTDEERALIGRWYAGGAQTDE